MSFGVLKWQRAVIDALVDQRPPVHSSVAALIPVLVKHADRHGEKVHPTQATMAREAGLHSETVRNALAWLRDQRLIVHVRNRARGLHEYALQIPDTRPSDQIAARGLSEPDRGSDRGSDRGYETTNGVTPVTPLEDINEEEACANCDRVDGHDPDCAYRPFEQGHKLKDLLMADQRAG